MNKFNYYFIVFLLFLVACSKDKDELVTGMEKESRAMISLPEAIFTETHKVANRESSTVIMDRLLSLIDASPENASIHLSVAGFSYPNLIRSLKVAGERGVKLHIMVDMSSEDSYAENMGAINDLKRSLKSNAEIVLIDNDAGSIAINHNKFALFSEVNTYSGKAVNLVFQTSHNWTISDTRKVQDAITISHEGLYDAFVKYWEDMKTNASEGMVNYYYKEFNDPEAGISAFFFPKRRFGGFYGGDTIIEILNGIDDPSSATIKIGMSLWTNTRMNIVEKLEELLARGATVEVITKHGGASTEIQNRLEKMIEKGANIKVYSRTNIHSKFMLIKGSWNGSKSSLIVTGSHNYTRNALRYNNETILLIKENEQLFKVYEDTYQKLLAVPE